MKLHGLDGRHTSGTPQILDRSHSKAPGVASNTHDLRDYDINVIENSTSNYVVKVL